jgi:membrane protein DedA with SNARE-associated domain
MAFIDWLRILVENHHALEYLIVFAGAAFGGEVVMISLGFLLAQGVFGLVPFIIASFLGTYSTDILWFTMGQTKWANKFFTHRYTSGTVHMITEAMRRISRGSDFVALLLANFMLASRIVLIMYVSKKKMNVVKFLIYEAVAVSLWLAAVIGIGYISGLGFTYLASTFKSIYVTIGFVLVILFAIVLAQIWFEKRLTKKEENI